MPRRTKPSLGPWTVDHDLIKNGDGHTIAEFGGNNANSFKPTSQELANVALICAAPDLLEVVVASLGDHDVTVWRDWREKAETAVAKATGKKDELIFIDPHNEEK